MSERDLPPSDPRHGLNGYSNLGCRCETCRRGNAAWQSTKRRDRAKALRVDPSIAKHGDSSTYLNYMCRCQDCRKAHAAFRRAQLSRSRRRSPTAPPADQPGTPGRGATT